MSAPLLAVESLGKAYPAASTAGARASALARILLGRPIRRFPVLQDIGFEIHPGQSLGVIGENGAGKSTLLKLICGVLHPTWGRVERRGSVGALLELGAGFDLEHSGRQNLLTAGRLMGMGERELQDKLEGIIGFADIGRYIDEPVKHYSSGMVVRLGFALVAAQRPDLLITDEVLAVGDESFQKKCIRWMEDYLDGGGTLLLVSHSMYHIQKLCKQALWLQQGRVQAFGDVFDVTQDYLAYHERKSVREIGSELDQAYSGEEYRIVALELNGRAEAIPLTLPGGEPLRLDARVFSPDGRCPQFGFGLLRADGTPVYGTSTEIDGSTGEALDAHHFRFRCEIDTSALLPGGYALKLHVLDPEGMRLFDTVDRGLTVRGASRELGLVRLPHRWGGGE